MRQLWVLYGDRPADQIELWPNAARAGVNALGRSGRASIYSFSLDPSPFNP
jgi:hypothetical protein